MTTIIDAYLHRFTGDRLSALRDDLRVRGLPRRAAARAQHRRHGQASRARRRCARSTPARSPGCTARATSPRASATTSSSRPTWAARRSTSASSCRARCASTSSTRSIDRWRVQVPMMDIKAIGAGGGSIARLDAVARRRGRSAVGRLDPGPRLLRPGRHRADGHRREPRARLPRPRRLPRRRASARRRRRASARSSGASPSRWGSTCSTRRGGSARSSTSAWVGDLPRGHAQGL